MRRRWSFTSRILMLMAAVCGVAAFLLVRGYASRYEGARALSGPQIPVVVASSELARGSRIEPSMLRLGAMPGAFAPPGALGRLEEAVGRTLLTDLAEGEALTPTRLGAGGAGPVAALVPPGLRAFAVPSSLPPAAVRPGDRVDVLATFGGGRPHTETTASGLEVLLVLAGGTDGAGGGIPGGMGTQDGPAVVLLTGPEQAERLAYASAFADISLTVAGTDSPP